MHWPFHQRDGIYRGPQEAQPAVYAGEDVGVRWIAAGPGVRRRGEGGGGGVAVAPKTARRAVGRSVDSSPGARGSGRVVVPKAEHRPGSSKVVRW